MPSKQYKLTPSQLSYTFKRLEKVNKWLKLVNYKLDKLVEFGFRKIPHDGVSKVVYINRRLKIVVKTPFIVQKKIIPKHAIPTIIISRKITGLYRNIFIQPLAKVNKRRNALKFLIRCHRSNDAHDRHSGNVGYYYQIPCWLDW